ncbi:hypothetical protein LWI29_014367 [Acer saccharum]|uniref:Uncharacterized protein n=1 Tax=Acer saccharum TaxID=4024 RepID=A0AA39TEI1_ACESA|nr:hypothetical protein LWI29_014367 [Acer saccharum]
MASTVPLPSSHLQPNFHIPRFMKWSTTQKEEDNPSTVIAAAAVDSLEKKESTAVPDHDRKPRIVIKLHKKDETHDHDHNQRQVQNQTLDGGDSSNQNIKPWSLRSSSLSSRKDQDHTSASVLPVRNQAQAQPSQDSMSPLGLGLGFVVEKLEKRKLRSFSIALSKEEIEADILAITGSKPTRRPKKRPKNVQRQLDTLFPGLCLKSITPNSYKVRDTI